MPARIHLPVPNQLAVVARAFACGRRRRTHGITPRLIALLLLACAAPLHAQSVRGRVMDAGTLTPVVGAHVLLLDAAGRRVRSVLTNDDGVFQLPVVPPGMYRVRAEMIGRASMLTTAMELATGLTQEVVLEMPIAPIRLDGLDVRAAQKCELPAAAARETQTVWEEARKALSVESAVRQQGLYRFNLMRYMRDVDEFGRVRAEDAHPFSRYTGEPFVSRPAEQLATEGYHTFENGQHNLSGPNSDVLLSSDFLATHCFFLRRDRERPQEIGLAFEPVPGRPMTDIEGVMWLNERTAELRSLEFSYTHLHRDLPAGDYGGTAEFQRLPSGGFIVRTWEIYSPIVQRFQNSIRDRRVSEVQVVGQRSEGGEVLSIIDREGNIVDAMPRAVLAGVVYDSTAGAPLVDAAVSLVGTNYTGRTDDTGRFRIPNLPPGTYAVSFEHAVLKSLDYTPPAVPVALVRGQATEVVLALPAGLRPVTDSAARSAQSDRAAVAGTQRTVEAAPSRDTRRGGPPSQLNGLVVDHGNSRPVREARVRIEGTNFDATTDGNGRFRFPDLPADTYTLVVERLGYVQQKNPIELESGRSYEVTVRLPARAVELDPITITVRSERLLEVGFYDRRESGLSGHYLTRADIDRRNTPYITDLLHNVPGVKVLYTEPGKRTVRFNRQVGASGRACEPDLYIDDRLYRASSPGMISSGGRVAWVSSGSNVDNFDAVPTVQVEGIEIYVGAATPIKYNSQCGVILLWTRHGEGN